MCSLVTTHEGDLPLLQLDAMRFVALFRLSNVFILAFAFGGGELLETHLQESALEGKEGKKARASSGSSGIRSAGEGGKQRSIPGMLVEFARSPAGP